MRGGNGHKAKTSLSAISYEYATISLSDPLLLGRVQKGHQQKANKIVFSLLALKTR